ncbi:MAG: glycoside hydrolase family 3 C-terminal domain-containing protein [Bifidobacteriaceae bacterium]|nr:glycoside hydrolase family 3 C-terminal domain-containing protein [Bifidobacteriaceae bacterium]
MRRRLVAAVIGLAMAVPLAGLASATATAAGAPTFTTNSDYVFRDNTQSTQARVDDLMSRLTEGEKIAIMVSGNLISIPRLGIQAARSSGGEGLHGVKDGSTVSTVFPSPLGMSQAFDSSMMEKIGDIEAKEALASNNPKVSLLAPVVDLLRDPRQGRAYEGMGEDPVLTGTLAIAETTGMSQRTSEDGYLQFWPTLKHFMGYGSEINRLWTNSVMPPRTMREYYVRPFEYPIAAGTAKSFMNSYPLVNGLPMTVNPIQSEALNYWTPSYPGTGHDEFTTQNDSGSGSSLWVHSQRYLEDNPAERALGVAEGVENGENSWSFRNFGSNSSTSEVYDAIARGLLTESDINEGAERAIAKAIRLGDLDQVGTVKDPYIAETATYRNDLLPEDAATALRASQEQIVLLKNDDQTLPLSSSATQSSGIVLLGSMGEDVLKDHYTSNAAYEISLQNALDNTFGKSDVHYSRAVDTVAFKASNGDYLKAADNQYSNPGSSTAADVPILADGTPSGSTVTLSDKDLLFQFYDYGTISQLLRTPINDLYVQVPHVLNSAYNKGLMVNNTYDPGQAQRDSGTTSYVNYQTFRIVPTGDGATADGTSVGIYNQIAGDGGNNTYGASAMAYDQDDEDLNDGSYVEVNGQDQLQADTVNDGPYRAKIHTDGASILTAPFDKNPNDDTVDNLPANYKYDMVTVQSSEDAIKAQVDAAPADAPIVMVVGYDPHLNAREAIDNNQTGLSAQQMRNIDYVTNTLGRDVVLVVKTGSPMTIDESVQDNARVKSILEIGQSGQEEGSALVSAMFDGGYSVPTTGFEPATDRYANPSSNKAAGAAYDSYPGYLPSGSRTIPAYAPAGRLSATWYKQVSDMIGASEDHEPASYRFPAYQESDPSTGAFNNDNLSNMDGTIPNGIETYDIIKGQRTYQYFDGTPLYPFGYGLTYANFDYSPITVSAVSGNTFTISGTVKNTGTVTSDEVVQAYSAFAGTPSRIKQANERLIAFTRLLKVAPGETRPYSFTVDYTDKLAVWDVETSKYIVEPGAYTIKVAKSSADQGQQATLDLTTGETEVTAAAVRNLDKETLATDFDDYSNISRDCSDMEIVATDADNTDPQSVSLRRDGAWLVYKDVDVAAGTNMLTMNVGSDRAGTIKVFAVPTGSAAPDFKTATPIAKLNVTNTRPDGVTEVGGGISPLAVNYTTGTIPSWGNYPYPGTAEGQATQDNYVRPDLQTRTAKATVSAGTYDIYVYTTQRGSRIQWLKLGTGKDKTTAVSISEIDGQYSIRDKGGSIDLDAQLTPVTSAQKVTWGISGDNVATIDPAGVLTAKGNANGTVTVTARSGSKVASRQILVTNQLDSNKVTINGSAQTIEYPIIRTGSSLGATDAISTYQGSADQNVIASGTFADNAEGYYLPGNFLSVPDSAITWKVTNLNGRATKLATIKASGLLYATGKGDGQVLVTATLKANPDISATRVMTLTGQTARDPYKLIQAETYNTTTAQTSSGATPSPATTWGKGGEQFGLEMPLDNGSVTSFDKVGFGQVKPGVAAVRVAPSTSADAGQTVTIKVWANTVGGKLLATVAGKLPDSTLDYSTLTADIQHAVTGTHTVLLEVDGASARVDWFGFNPAGSTPGASVDRTALAAAIAQAQGLDAAGYTAGSWAACADALTDALAVNTDTTATQAAVDAATEALQTAIASLVPMNTVTGIEAAQSVIGVRTGKTIKLPVQVYTTGGSTDVTWSSANPAIATVAADGTIKGVKAGHTTVTATAVQLDASGSHESVTATVYVSATKVALTSLSAQVPATLTVGSTAHVAVVIAPLKTTGDKVTFTSSKPAVFTVDGAGTITGVAQGQGVLTIKASDASVEYTVKVTVA